MKYENGSCTDILRYYPPTLAAELFGREKAENLAPTAVERAHQYCVALWQWQINRLYKRCCCFYGARRSTLSRCRIWYRLLPSNTWKRWSTKLLPTRQHQQRMRHQRRLLALHFILVKAGACFRSAWIFGTWKRRTTAYQSAWHQRRETSNKIERQPG